MRLPIILLKVWSQLDNIKYFCAYFEFQIFNELIKLSRMKNSILYALAFMLAVSVVACKKDKGEAAVTSEAGKVKKVEADATYKVNTDASKVLWEGYKPSGTHNGSINISEGTVQMKDGKLSAGEFVLDMNSITVLDLSGDDKAGLEGHLKGSKEENSDHFFNVAQYPTGTFKITKVVGLTSEDSDANYMVYGNLNIKDKTSQIGFKANVMASGNVVTVTTPKFQIDRTKWNVNYKSKSAFKNLGDKFINDEIGLSITLAANK